MTFLAVPLVAIATATIGLLVKGDDPKTALISLLVTLLFISAVPVILINGIAWIRFESRYRRAVSEDMPPVLFDFRGRWWRARSIRQPDPDVERARRILQLSYLALLIPFALAMALGLVVSLSR